MAQKNSILTPEAGSIWVTEPVCQKNTEIESPASLPSILLALRAQTHEIHQRLHVHPVTQPLVEPSLSIAHYIFALRVFEGFHAAIERCLGFFDMPYKPQPSVAFLHADLKVLGASTEALPVCPDFQMVNDINDFFGVMYVVEGSKLGGLQIAKNIKKTLNLGVNTGSSFFCGEGKKTTLSWQKFITLLETQSNNVPRVASSAKATFLYLETWMNDMWQFQASKNQLNHSSKVGP